MNGKNILIKLFNDLQLNRGFAFNKTRQCTYKSFVRTIRNGHSTRTLLFRFSGTSPMGNSEAAKRVKEGVINEKEVAWLMYFDANLVKQFATLEETKSYAQFMERRLKFKNSKDEITIDYHFNIVTIARKKPVYIGCIDKDGPKMYKVFYVDDNKTWYIH